MRVRIVVAAALSLVGVGLVRTLSHRVALNAGSDHVVPAIFSATLPTGGVLCQADPDLTPGATSAQIVIGTYGYPVPRLELHFTDAAGAIVASGHLAGAREGPVSIPISAARNGASATRLCLRVGGHTKTVIGGLAVPPGPTDETVNGVAQPGRISVLYSYRAGLKSWWSLRSAIDQRFGRGKASFFGDWTLPACILVLLGTWTLTVRLLTSPAQ